MYSVSQVSAEITLNLRYHTIHSLVPRVTRCRWLWTGSLSLSPPMPRHSTLSYSFETAKYSAAFPHGMLKNGNVRQCLVSTTKERVPTRWPDSELNRLKADTVLFGNGQAWKFSEQARNSYLNWHCESTSLPEVSQNGAESKSHRIWKAGEVLYRKTPCRGSLKLGSLAKNVPEAPISPDTWLGSDSHTQVLPVASLRCGVPHKTVPRFPCPTLWALEPKSFPVMGTLFDSGSQNYKKCRLIV